MKIKIECEKAFKKSQRAHDELKQYAKEAKRIILWLSKQFDFDAPAVLNMRPLYNHDGVDGYGGRAFRSNTIALNLPKIRQNRERSGDDNWTGGLIFHECCHIAEFNMFGKAGHGKPFRMLNESIAHYNSEYIKLDC